MAQLSWAPDVPQDAWEHPQSRYSPSGSGRVQARSSEAVGSVYVKACRQHVLITKQGHYAILLS